MKSSNSLGCNALKVVLADGRQKFTSTTPLVEAWSRNQSLSVMATYIRIFLLRKYTVRLVSYRLSCLGLNHVFRIRPVEA